MRCPGQRRVGCQPLTRCWYSRLLIPSAGSRYADQPALTRDRAIGTDHLNLKTGRGKQKYNVADNYVKQPIVGNNIRRTEAAQLNQTFLQFVDNLRTAALCT